MIADQRLYYLKPVENVAPDFIGAALNSSLTALSVEMTVPLTAGDGICELRVEDARDYLLVPDVRIFSAAAKKETVEAFRKLLGRSIGSVFDEMKQADRHALDSAVLKGIGLDPKKYLKPLYQGLCELTQERIDLGRTRGKARKTKARGVRAEKRIAEEVLDELLPEGPGRFPDDFFSQAAAKGAKTTIDLPEETLIFVNSPMFRGVHTECGSYDRDVTTPAEGKFLVYAQRAGQKVAALPEKTVEVTRTVANYEKNLRELRNQLYEAYYRRTLDTKTAARLTQAAFDRFHLPNVESLT